MIYCKNGHIARRDKRGCCVVCIAKKGERYRKKYPEKVRIASCLRYRKRIRKNQYETLLASSKKRAKIKGLPFNLTKEWAAQRWTGKCEISNLPFDFSLKEQNKTPNPYSPSIDRIRPEYGYTVDNCRFVLFSINWFKGSGSDDDMRLIASAILGA